LAQDRREGQGRDGRRKLRWKEEVEMDLRKTKTTRWKEIKEERIDCWKDVEQAESHAGSYSLIRRRTALYVPYNLEFGHLNKRRSTKSAVEPRSSL
jgi:hypothetical protein